MSDDFGLDDFSVFVNVLPMVLVLFILLRFAQILAECGVFAGRANVQNGHALKFFGGVAVLAHGGIVYLEKAQRFFVENPGGEWVVVEEEAKHRRALDQRIFGATAFDS